MFPLQTENACSSFMNNNFHNEAIWQGLRFHDRFSHAIFCDPRLHENSNPSSKNCVLQFASFVANFQWKCFSCYNHGPRFQPVFWWLSQGWKQMAAHFFSWFSFSSYFSRKIWSIPVPLKNTKKYQKKHDAKTSRVDFCKHVLIKEHHS